MRFPLDKTKTLIGRDPEGKSLWIENRRDSCLDHLQAGRAAGGRHLRLAPMNLRLSCLSMAWARVVIVRPIKNSRPLLPYRLFGEQLRVCVLWYRFLRGNRKIRAYRHGQAAVAGTTYCRPGLGAGSNRCGGRCVSLLGLQKPTPA
jgi:hypothetical protein